MELLPLIPEKVPFDEVAEVLADAAKRVMGGPPALVTASGGQLAAALETAGFRVARDAAPNRQLTL